MSVKHDKTKQKDKAEIKSQEDNKSSEYSSSGYDTMTEKVIKPTSVTVAVDKSKDGQDQVKCDTKNVPSSGTSDLAKNTEPSNDSVDGQSEIEPEESLAQSSKTEIDDEKENGDDESSREESCDEATKPSSNGTNTKK